jgi:hypothetical protein
LEVYRTAIKNILIAFQNAIRISADILIVFADIIRIISTLNYLRRHRKQLRLKIKIPDSESRG